MSKREELYAAWNEALFFAKAGELEQEVLFGRTITHGICYLLRQMCLNGCISQELESEMWRQLSKRFDPKGLKGFYWPRSQIAPRIAAIKALRDQQLRG